MDQIQDDMCGYDFHQIREQEIQIYKLVKKYTTWMISG